MADVQFEEGSSPSKTAKEAIAIMVLTIVVSIVAILLIMNLVTGGMRIDPDSPAMSEDSIAKRLKPVGEVIVASGLDTTGDDAVAGSEMGVDAADEGTAAAGEQVYNTVCVPCHVAGLAGAPKIGDKAAWKTRIAQGMDVLYDSAVNGKNTMPAKGGASALPDADIKAAVDLMVAESR